MPEVPTSWIEEAILQLLKERETIKNKNRLANPQEKEEQLASINFELNLMIERYTERTGKTLDDFLNERKEEKAKEREENKFSYI